MTAAEREVGLLILKGLSHKEIASLRATTEATVRQQAQAIYRKAGLPGKTAFSAYFLEDLFSPDLAPDLATNRADTGTARHRVTRTGAAGRSADRPLLSFAAARRGSRRPRRAIRQEADARVSDTCRIYRSTTRRHGWSLDPR